MKDYIETVYEDICMMTLSMIDRESINKAVESMKMRLGNASEVLEDMFYERLGISLDDILELFGVEALLP